MTSSRAIVKCEPRADQILRELFRQSLVVLNSVLTFRLLSPSLRLPRSLPPDPTFPKAEKVNGGNGPRKTHYEVCGAARAVSPGWRSSGGRRLTSLPHGERPNGFPECSLKAGNVLTLALSRSPSEVAAGGASPRLENFYHLADKMAQCHCRSSSRGYSLLSSSVCSALKKELDILKGSVARR